MSALVAQRLPWHLAVTYEAVQAYVGKHGFDPTLRELAEAIGVPLSTANARVATLVKRGVLARRRAGKYTHLHLPAPPSSSGADPKLAAALAATTPDDDAPPRAADPLPRSNVVRFEPPARPASMRMPEIVDALNRIQRQLVAALDDIARLRAQLHAAEGKRSS